ncbi:MAG: hypothetical protein CMJ49_10145 [Planctomycetaceae bacterium]|nr:hypothetical protein [Planctomycetaceae bacterium]
MEAEVARAVAAWEPDYVEAFGLDILPLLAAAGTRTRRVWTASDDWCVHHLTRARSARTWREGVSAVRAAILMLAYERSFARSIDAAVAVSGLDRWGLRHLGGIRRVMLSPCGVDAKYFHPVASQPRRASAVFWGRLDYEPNIEAVCWFARHVWPRLISQHRGARWRIIGRAPDARVRDLARDHEGIDLHANVDDLRPLVWDSAAVVIPMRSGSGVKNKLLEATAMGRAVVVSPRAERGLADRERPWCVARSADDWVRDVDRLWCDAGYARRLGDAAHRWALAHHEWERNAIQREDYFGAGRGAVARDVEAEQDQTIRRAAA